MIKVKPVGHTKLTFVVPGVGEVTYMILQPVGKHTFRPAELVKTRDETIRQLRAAGIAEAT